MSVGLPGRGRLPYHTDPESEVSLICYPVFVGKWVVAGSQESFWGRRKHMKSILRSSTPWLLALALVLATCAGFGQAVSSTILGTVTDSSGAVVSNAKVTVTNIDTQISRSAQSNESGNFNF